MTDGEPQAKLNLAKEQLNRVQTASGEPQDPEDAVIWAFYGYENAVVAGAEKAGIVWAKNHPSKQQAARDLHAAGHVSVDISDELDRLNELRKDVSYGESGSDLKDEDLEALASELETFIDEIAKFVESDG